MTVYAFRWRGEDVPGLERIGVGLGDLADERFNLVVPTRDGPRYAAEGDWGLIDSDGDNEVLTPADFPEMRREGIVPCP